MYTNESIEREDDDLFDMSEKSCNSDDETNPKFKETEDSVEKESSAKTGKQSVTKTKRLSKNIRLKLDPNRLCSQRGILAVLPNFQNVKLKGKGYEKADLDLILSKMEHWAHRLFPKLPFDDCVEQVAKIGNNRLVQVCMKKFRNETQETEIQDEEDHSNTMSGSVNNVEDEINTIVHHCSDPIVQTMITKEQQNRMNENRRRAEEKRRSRLLIEDTSQPSTDACSKDKECDVMETELSFENNLVESTIDEEVLEIDEFLEHLP